MIEIVKCTQEKRPRDRSRKRFMLRVPSPRGRMCYHLTDEEVRRMRAVLRRSLK